MENKQPEPSQPVPQGSQKTLIISFCILLIAALTGIGYAMWKNLPITIVKEQDLSYPYKSEGITIDSAEHDWREVNEEDRVESSSLYIPTVELNYGADTNGSFVCFFENNEGDIMGDGIAYSVINGKVNGNETHLLKCSRGYSSKASYKGYYYAQAPYWHLVVRKVNEGSEPTEIIRIPLPPQH